MRSLYQNSSENFVGTNRRRILVIEEKNKNIHKKKNKIRNKNKKKIMYTSTSVS